MTSAFNPQATMELGPYRLIEEVGRGGLGRVFKAHDTRNGQIVAIKFLHEKFTSDPRILGIFHKELLIVAGLKNKHIVAYLDSYFEPPVCYIVTEFVEGWSGHQFIRKVGRKVPPLVALSVTIDILQGIDYLHLHDTVHSDLSASNFMVDKNGRVFVTDFGLSCQLQVEDYKNYMVGTPGYYSPEHVTEQPFAAKSDIYCVGLLLYEMITGEKAVRASSDRKVVIDHMKNINFDRIEIENKKMKKMVVSLLKKVLSFNGWRRMETAEKMMLGCYKILKAHEIRFARFAIKQFLIDQKVVQDELHGPEQDIYVD